MNSKGTSILLVVHFLILLLLLQEKEAAKNDEIYDNNVIKNNQQLVNLKPDNISLVVTQWSPPVVRIAWQFNQSEHGVDLHTKIIPKKLEAFRVTYHPIRSRYRMIQEVSPSARNISLDRLRPKTEYLLKIYPVFQNELIGEPSHSIRFISPDDEPSRYAKKHGSMLIKVNPGSPQIKSKGGTDFLVRTEEVVIVSVIILIWMSFILLFIKKWGRIRTLEPRCFLPKELLEGGVVSSPEIPSSGQKRDSADYPKTCGIINTTNTSLGTTTLTISGGDRVMSPFPAGNAFHRHHLSTPGSASRDQYWSRLKKGVVKNNTGPFSSSTSDSKDFSVADVYSRAHIVSHGFKNNESNNNDSICRKNRRNQLQLSNSSSPFDIVNNKKKNSYVNNTCFPVRNDCDTVWGNNRNTSSNNNRLQEPSRSSSPGTEFRQDSCYNEEEEGGGDDVTYSLQQQDESVSSRSSSPFNNLCFQRERSTSSMIGSFNLKKKYERNCLPPASLCFNNKEDPTLISSQSLSKLNGNSFCYTFGSKGCSDSCRAKRKVKDSAINFSTTKMGEKNERNDSLPEHSAKTTNEIIFDEKVPLLSKNLVVDLNNKELLSQEERERRKSEGRQGEERLGFFNPYSCTSFSNNHINTFLLYDQTQGKEKEYKGNCGETTRTPLTGTHLTGTPLTTTPAASSDSKERRSASSETDLLNKNKCKKERNDAMKRIASVFKNEVGRDKKRHKRKEWEGGNNVWEKKTTGKNPLKNEEEENQVQEKDFPRRKSESAIIENWVFSCQRRQRSSIKERSLEQEGDRKDDRLEEENLKERDQRRRRRTLHVDDTAEKNTKYEDNPRVGDTQEEEERQEKQRKEVDMKEGMHKVYEVDAIYKTGERHDAKQRQELYR